MTRVQQCITEQLLQELETNEKEIEESNKAKTIKSAQENLDQLGILKNLERVKFPNFGKMTTKRGIKLLKELKEADGKAWE